MVIAIVGNVSFNKCIALTEKHAGVISENMRNIQRQAFTQYSVLSKTKRIHGLQAHAMIGRALPHYDEKKNQTAVLLNNILGGPGLNSRLNLAIREKNGYVYNIESLLCRFERRRNILRICRFRY